MNHGSPQCGILPLDHITNCYVISSNSALYHILSIRVKMRTRWKRPDFNRPVRSTQCPNSNPKLTSCRVLRNQPFKSLCPPHWSTLIYENPLKGCHGAQIFGATWDRCSPSFHSVDTSSPLGYLEPLQPKHFIAADMNMFPRSRDIGTNNWKSKPESPYPIRDQD